MNKYHWTPDVWANLDNREKAVVIAGIDIRVKEEEKERKKSEKKSRRRR